MKELFGEDIFDKIGYADVVCIPTNCSRIKDTDAGFGYINPMGALAGAFASKWLDIPHIYAELLKKCGNVPCVLGYLFQDPDVEYKKYNLEPYVSDIPNYYDEIYTTVVAFPTMHEIGEPASIELVERSAELLVEMANRKGWKNIYVPAVGTGVGGLSYQDQVKPVLEKYFDDRFWVMNK